MSSAAATAAAPSPSDDELALTDAGAASANLVRKRVFAPPPSAPRARAPAEAPAPAPPAEAPDTLCKRCERRAAERLECGACRCVVYCSRACQQADWEDGDHKRVCGVLARVFAREFVNAAGLALIEMRFEDLESPFDAEGDGVGAEVGADGAPAPIGGPFGGGGARVGFRGGGGFVPRGGGYWSRPHWGPRPANFWASLLTGLYATQAYPYGPYSPYYYY